MAEKASPTEADREQSERSDDYVRGGKGRKDEVGHSGIYPASAGNAPPDAEIRRQGEFGRPHEARPVEKPDVEPNSPIRPTD